MLYFNYFLSERTRYVQENAYFCRLKALIVK